MTHTFLLKCSAPSATPKAHSGESTRADVHLYLTRARGSAAGICNGADVRAKSGSLEPLRHLLDVNVEIRGLNNHIFHRLQRSGGSLAHRLLFSGLWHHTLLFCVHGAQRRPFDLNCLEGLRAWYPSSIT